MLKIQIKFTDYGYVLIVEDEVYDIYETHREATKVAKALRLAASR